MKSTIRAVRRVRLGGWWYGMLLRRAGLLVGAILFCVTPGTFAQTSEDNDSSVSVAIAPLISDGAERSDAIAREVTLALESTLLQMDGYSIDGVDGATERTARRVVGDRDFLIYGSVNRTDSSSRINLAVYSRAEDATTETYQRDIVSAFEVFSAAEDAAIELLEALSGRTLRFGTILFRNTGVDGVYYVIVNDRRLPDSEDRRRVLVGSHRVVVAQDRMVERFILVDRVVELAAGEEVVIDFAVPGMTALERRRLIETEDQIAELWDDPTATAVVVMLFDRLSFLLADVTYSVAIATKRDEYQRWRDEFEAMAHRRGTPPRVPAADPSGVPRETGRGRVGLRLGLGPNGLNNDRATKSLSFVEPLADDAPEERRSFEQYTYGLRGFVAAEVFRWIDFGGEIGFARSWFLSEKLTDRSTDLSGLDLNGDYARRRSETKKEVVELTVYGEPHLDIAGGVTAVVRVGQQIAFGRTELNTEFETFVSGTSSNVSTSDSAFYGVDLGILFGTGLRYDRERYGFEFLYLIAPSVQTFFATDNPVFGPRGQIQIGAYWNF